MSDHCFADFTKKLPFQVHFIASEQTHGSVPTLIIKLWLPRMRMKAIMLSLGAILASLFIYSLLLLLRPF